MQKTQKTLATEPSAVLELYQTVKADFSTKTDVIVIAKQKLTTLFSPRRKKTVESSKFRRTQQFLSETFTILLLSEMNSQYCDFGTSSDLSR